LIHVLALFIRWPQCTCKCTMKHFTKIRELPIPGKNQISAQIHTKPIAERLSPSQHSKFTNNEHATCTRRTTLNIFISFHLILHSSYRDTNSGIHHEVPQTGDFWMESPLK
jgi:hypothetical protein